MSPCPRYQLFHRYEISCLFQCITCRFVLGFTLPPHSPPSSQVEVTFALDANGILAVTAQDTVTGAKAGAEIKAKDGRLSAEEIDRMVQEAEKFREQDEELADKVSAVQEYAKLDSVKRSDAIRC